MPDLDLFLLDPGAVEYGDCVFCLAGGKSILVDGGKKASARETRDTVLGREVVHRSIQDQIEALHGSTAVDLLIITHCHSDHVGALPDLVRNGVIECEWALIADPQFGFGIGGEAGPFPPVEKMTPAEKLWLALREEPTHSRSDAEVRAFIEDAAGQYHEYVGLAEFLDEKLGAQCVRYRGPSETDSEGLDALLAAFASTGLKILGPSLKQLGNCAKYLIGRSEDVAALNHDFSAEGAVDLVDAYRRELARAPDGADVHPDGEFLDDTPENGNAVNNQSLVLTIGSGRTRALLTADMQLARTQLGDDAVKAEMIALRGAIAQDVAANGTYGFIKLSHHGATNGHNRAMLEGWGSGLFGISTGSSSSKHPTAPVLAALDSLAAGPGAKWGRTDLNGCVTYRVRGGQETLLKERGVWNDATPPAQRAGDSAPAEHPHPGAVAASVPAQVTVGQLTEGNVEVTIRFPYGKGKVRVTIETDPEGTASPLF